MNSLRFNLIFKKENLYILSSIILFMLTLITQNITVIFILYLASIFIIFNTDFNNKVKLPILLLSLVVLLPLAVYSNTYFIGITTQVLMYSVLAIGLNIVVGFSGLLDLGYVAFYASGAYFYAIFSSNSHGLAKYMPFIPISGNWFWIFLILSMIIAALIGIVLGLPVLRLRGDYLAIVTLGFGEIIRIILNNLDKPVNITNGPKGLIIGSAPEIFGMKLDKPIHFYFIILVILVLAIVIVDRVNKSRIGRAFCAIKEDEIAAKTMGIPLVRTKLLAFAFGASFAGMVGVIFSAKQLYIDPSSFGFMESIGILAMVILGGLGNIRGAILGASILTILQGLVLKDISELLRDFSTAGYINISSQLDPAKFEKFLFGIILVVVCIFRPKGILPGQRNIDYLKRKVKIRNME